MYYTIEVYNNITILHIAVSYTLVKHLHTSKRIFCHYKTLQKKKKKGIRRLSYGKYGCGIAYDRL